MKEFIKEEWGALVGLAIMAGIVIYAIQNPSPSKQDVIDVQKNQIEQARVYVESLARVEKELKRIGDHLEAKPLLPDVRLEN